MSSPALWSLLHDAFGDGRDRLLAEVIGRVTSDALRALPLAGLKALHPGVKSEVWEAFYQVREAETDRLATLQALGVEVIRIGQEGYPPALYDLYDPPPILYRRGAPLPEGQAIAVVGSRKCTHYGKDVAERFGRDLSLAGCLVVSGLARGIDGQAHRGALKGPGGTLAVLGCGIDVVYPAEHKKLVQEIFDHPRGTVLSECPLGAQPLPFRFPRRNRIVAALSQGVLVVEAAQKSGALITVRLANEIGRDCFAVPGLITSSASQGPHALIQDGAKLVTKAQDILEEYGQLQLFEAPESKPSQVPLDGDQEKVLACLSAVPLSLETIVEKTGLPVHQVVTAMSLLEIYGLAQEVVGRQYKKQEG